MAGENGRWREIGCIPPIFGAGVGDELAQCLQLVMLTGQELLDEVHDEVHNYYTVLLY